MRTQELTANQLRAIALEMAGWTVVAIAKELKVSEEGVFLWKRKKEYKEEIRARRKELFDIAMNQLSSEMVNAVGVIKGVLNHSALHGDSDSEKKLRVDVAKYVIDRVGKHLELSDLAAEVEELRERLEAQSHAQP